MKLLITGGCGFLGSNLAANAISRGLDLYLFDNLSRDGSQDNLKWLRDQGKFQFFHGDIRNASDVDNVVRSIKPDAVFHLAGQVAMTTSISNPRLDFEVNALGTLNILEAIKCHVPKSLIIYSSTNKVYGDLEQYNYQETETRYICPEYPEGFTEETNLNFNSPYGCSKGSADQYLLDYSRIFGMKTVVFRHSTMYGGRQFATTDQGWIGWFCKMAAETKAGLREVPFTISGNGKQVRDVLHVTDITALYFSLLENHDVAVGHAFNVGGGAENSLSLLELFAILEKNIGLSMVYEKINPRQSDQKVFIADLRRIKSVSSWRPTINVDMGVRAMLDWSDCII